MQLCLQLLLFSSLESDETSQQLYNLITHYINAK